ncbi:hypothetical protein K491DRAFT_718137 [Lophiostoma macrostomum CBS 122681]|uniref:Uncharacterized protein n=1 Tax=Lophiostoma macrostomum CBS 122681 TaxID=1314788 RepID=A0A6A6T326_9PLEO|nr:hypothetical protein K491DRAFT_718137 [Lophiostoma macrostomum CBS 122681]
MFNANTALLLQAVQECTGFRGEDLYACLQDHIGASELRTTKEILLRSLGIHVISLASYGHLLSVQGLTSSRSSAVYQSPLLFFLLPGLAIVQPLVRSCRVCIRKFHRPGRTSLGYCIAAGLGTWVLVKETGGTKALESLEEEHVRCKRREYGFVWLGRVALLLGLLVQYVGSIAIWLHSTFVFDGRMNMFFLLDLRTVEVVIGGAAATINNIFLLLMNLDWHDESLATAPIELNDEQRIPTPLPVPHPHPSPQSEEIHIPPTKPWYEHFARLRHINSAISTMLSTLTPSTLQLDIEFALLAQIQLHLILFAIICALKPRRSGVCPPVFQLLATSPPDPGKVFCSEKMQHAIPYPWVVVHVILGLLSQTAAQGGRMNGSVLVVLSLYYILIARVLLHLCYHSTVRLCSASKLKFEDGPLVVRRLVQVLQWLLGCRTITSPLFFLVFVVTVVLRWKAFISAAIQAKEAEKFLFEEDGSWYRVHRVLLMFKDPWYDSMYIL